MLEELKSMRKQFFLREKFQTPCSKLHFPMLEDTNLSKMLNLSMESEIKVFDVPATVFRP